MADDQTGYAPADVEDSTGLENLGLGGWPSGVQMPSGGLLDPTGQGQAGFSSTPANPVTSIGGAQNLVAVTGDFASNPNTEPSDANQDYGLGGGGYRPGRWDQPFQIAGDNSGYAMSAGTPELHFKSLQDRLADPNVDKLKDEYGNPRGTQYLVAAPHHDYSWEILGDYLNLGLSLLAARADPELTLDAREKLAEDEFANRPALPYDRIPQYGRTPKPADRAAIGAGLGQVADHQPTLAERWYFGDWARGEIPGYLMTPSQRAQSAADRTRMNVQSQRDSNVQGGHMAAFSRQMKRKFRIGLESED
jgi:hypothetical protein